MKEMKVQPIKNGTVIDHIPQGMALRVLRILNVDERIGSTVSVLMHVHSQKHGLKDVVKIEDRELKPKEVDKISLIAPNATINIIRNYIVAEKYVVKVPDEVHGIVRCTNLSCISNDPKECVEPRFITISKKPIILKCKYCEREIEDVASQIII
jgi:aspartate carbamoyltransferase regulatory subunit